MHQAHNSQLASTALALAAEDPVAGTIELKSGWSATVVAEAEGAAPRRLNVTSPGDGQIVLIRSAGLVERPTDYPETVPFVASETVWVGTSPIGGAAIWIHPRNPAEVASAAVAQSVQAGWDMTTSVNLAVPGVKMVKLKQGALRRGVSIVSGHVMLNDAMETRDGSRSSS